MEYDRNRAVAYAHEWAYGRNLQYYNFNELGGDCTNFISQCIYAGCGVMNYSKVLGWYYGSPNSHSPSWTGVPFLYNFLTANKKSGPYGHEAPLIEASPGDIVQLSFDGIVYSHSLIIVSTGTIPDLYNTLVATHTYDSDNRKLSSYIYVSYRFIRIDGARR